MRSYRKSLTFALFSAFALTLQWVPLPSSAKPASDLGFEMHGHLEQILRQPVYRWPSQSKPKGVVLAVHGLIMHGTSFDALGKTLSNQGFDMYATDLRGYGRLRKDYPHEFCTTKDCKQKIDYQKSARDVEKLVQSLRSQNPGLPIYLVGESLGASVIIRLAASRSDLVDGLILSSPALSHHWFLDRHAISHLAPSVAAPSRGVDLRHYMKNYASDDPQVVDEMLNDPYVRKELSMRDILHSTRTIRSTLNHVSKIDPQMPVLIMQGTGDRCIKANAVVSLQERLRVKDQTVRWFDKRGHILLETAHIKPDTMAIVVDWINEHTESGSQRARSLGNMLSSGSLGELDDTP